MADLLAALRPRECRPSGCGSMCRSPAGSDYYTGTIFETFLDKLPAIGSVCSGGRYDNLAECIPTATAGHRRLAGPGPAAGRHGRIGTDAKVATPAEVFIPFFDAARLHDYLRLGR